MSLIQQITRHKSIEQLQSEAGARGELRRTLELVATTAIGLGGIIGVGIFVLAGQQAAVNAGPAVALAFILAGIASAAAALCYAEFAGMIPVTGSAYTYGCAVLGEGVVWLIGWDLLLEYALIVAAVASGWAGYLQNSARAYRYPFAGLGAGAMRLGDGRVFNVIAALVAMGVAVLLSMRTETGARLNTIVVAIKVVGVALVIGVGAFYINSANWSPFIPPEVVGADGKTHFGFHRRRHGGLGRVLRGIWLRHADHGRRRIEESAARSAARDPAVAGSVDGAVPDDLVRDHRRRALHHAQQRCAGRERVPVAGPYLGQCSDFRGRRREHHQRGVRLHAGCSPHLVLAVARWPVAGLVCKVHPKYGTPYRPTLILGVLTGLAAGALPIGDLAELVNVGVLCAFIVICSAIIVLRRTRPDVKRAFRTPLVPLVPISRHRVLDLAPDRPAVRDLGTFRHLDGDRPPRLFRLWDSP